MKEKIYDIIKSLCPALDLDDENLNLAEDMDSLDIIALIEELEETFDIEIGMKDKSEENFENIDSLVTMIKNLQ